LIISAAKKLKVRVWKKDQKFSPQKNNISEISFEAQHFKSKKNPNAFEFLFLSTSPKIFLPIQKRVHRNSHFSSFINTLKAKFFVCGNWTKAKELLEFFSSSPFSSFPNLNEISQIIYQAEAGLEPPSSCSTPPTELPRLS